MLHWSTPLFHGDLPSSSKNGINVGGMRSPTATMIPPSSLSSSRIDTFSIASSSSFLASSSIPVNPIFLRGGSKMLVCGTSNFTGNDDTLNEESNRVLLFDPDTMYWYLPKVSGLTPSRRQSQSSVLIDGHKLFVFGGGFGTKYFSDLFVLDTNTMLWTKPECKGKVPDPRKSHSAVAFGKKMFVFGGGNGSNAVNETYVLDTEKMEWDLLKTSGQVPNPRGYHSANVFGDKMLVYGGCDGEICYNDLYVFDPAIGIWTEKKLMNKGVPSFGHSSAVVGNMLFIFGGHNGSKQVAFNNDLRIATVDLRTEMIPWTKKSCTGIPPSPRAYHTALVYDSRLFVFGGFDGRELFGDIHILDLGIYAYSATK